EPAVLADRECADAAAHVFQRAIAALDLDDRVRAYRRPRRVEGRRRRGGGLQALRLLRAGEACRGGRLDVERVVARLATEDVVVVDGDLRPLLILTRVGELSAWNQHGPVGYGRPGHRDRAGGPGPGPDHGERHREGAQDTQETLCHIHPLAY